MTLGGRIKIIEKSLVSALESLCRKLAPQGLKWIVAGDCAEALQVVQVDPDYVEILTDSKDAQKIWSIMRDLNPTPIAFSERPLTRNAVIGGKEYPIIIRSHFFEFDLSGVKVKVYGDKQFKIDDWDWGDPLDVEPRYVNIVGQQVPVVPLSIELEIYEKLGWTDRIEKIKHATSYLKERQR